MRSGMKMDAGDLTVSTVQDVEPIIAWNREARRDQQSSDWGRHVARIPNVVLMQWLDEEFKRGHDIQLFSDEFDRLVDRKLKDPEFAYLRTDRPALQVGWH